MKKIFKLLIILTFILIIYGCDKTTTTTISYLDVDYSDFVGQFIEEAEEQLSMPEEVYYIYYYGPRCTACDIIKPEVLDTFYRAKQTTIYLVAVLDEFDINEDSGVTHTPTIIKVENNEVTDFYEGITNIREMLNEIT